MSTPDYSAIGLQDLLVRLDDSVVIVIINRARQRNTFGKNIVTELIQVFDLCDRDDRVRAVILTAEPSAPAFCSGADLSGGWDILWEPYEAKEGETSHRDSGGMVSMAIYRCRKITIVAVNGHAAGAGTSALQLPFDFRFIWAGAKLTFPFVRRGIVAEATSTYLLPRLLGHSRATSLLLTGSTVSPDSPYIQGLYHQIFPTREEVFPAAMAFARELVANTASLSIAYTKALLQHPGNSIEENHLLDSRALKSTGGTQDAIEGLQSFKERRPPKFQNTLAELSAWYPWWSAIDTKYRLTKL